ncbi:hypothetical protein, conserved [Leishmania tarentolae]|uniref:REH2 DRSM domain-containing protein n=1 Tax=Leishmania tarentolae TaxID=5689 RepID=A0A640KL89_LEITA|nr:hypothetical protein, conserved [Leishmania tarentolae]
MIPPTYPPPSSTSAGTYSSASRARCGRLAGENENNRAERTHVLNTRRRRVETTSSEAQSMRRMPLSRQNPCRTLTLLQIPRLRCPEWRRSCAINIMGVPTLSRVFCGRRAVHGGGVMQNSATVRGAVDETHFSSSPRANTHIAENGRGTLVNITQVDTFSQSRIKNYIQRVARPLEGCASMFSGNGNGRSFGTEVTPRLLTAAERPEYAAHIGPTLVEKVWISSFDIPVDVLVDAKMSRRMITVTGLAMEAKLAVLAACMHAERCLDALNIPLFTSEKRQHQRVLQAQAEGRVAPEVTAEPLELSSVHLPLGVFLPAATSAEAIRAAGKARSFQQLQTSSGPTNYGRDGGARTTSRASTQDGSSRPGKGLLRRPPRRWDMVKPRYGGEWFIRVTLDELATLQSTIVSHNRSLQDEHDDEEFGEMDSVVISPHEVQILQPEVSPATGAAATAATADSVCKTRQREAHGAHVPPAPKVLAYERMLVNVQSKSAHAMVDETEGGAFDLVEDDSESWWHEKEMPGSRCLRDPGAVARVSRFLERLTGHDLDSSIQTRAAEEDTNVWQQQPLKVNVKLKTWYTTWLDIPRIPVPAVGKATTQEGARDLCAMHAELLLQWFGIHVYDTPREQAMYFDACLRWGRLIAAEPIDPATVDVKTANLPKPLKEWFRSISRLRSRRSERSVAEKLLHLNRVVAHTFRNHLVEVSMVDSPEYQELLSLAGPCLRSFMVAVKHPYENAVFCYVYCKDFQYRSTVYLPLPERYGVRGGYSIASTPELSIALCGLHAVDVLCALDVVPAVCMEQPRWQRMMEVRESLGLIMPPSYLYKKQVERASSREAAAVLRPPPPPHSRLRSPPAYRDVPMLSSTRIPPYQEVWQIMLTDADIFDVAPDLHALADDAKRLQVGSVFDIALILFEEFAQYAFGWQIGQRRQGEYLFHYVGPQHYRGAARRIANNFWMELPFDKAVYGRRVALGRCFSRKGAERMMYMHALRIAHALKATPWDTLPLSKLAEEVYSNNQGQATLRQEQWKWVCSTLLECTDVGGVTEGLQNGGASIHEAEIMQEFVRPMEAEHAVAATGSDSAVAADGHHDGHSTIDLRHVLSPHPVMSRDLAITTMV